MISIGKTWLPTLVLLALFVGCSKQSDPGAAAPSEAGASSATETTSQAEMPVAEATPAADGAMVDATKPAAEPVVPVAPEKRTSMAGKWIVVLTQEATDFPTWLLDVKLDGDAGQATVLATAEAVSESKLSSSEVTAKTIHAVFELGENKFDFQGVLAEDGAVYGNVLLDDGRCDPARLRATQAASLENLSNPTPTPGRDQLISAYRSNEPLKELNAFCENNSTTPLVLPGYQAKLAVSAAQGLDQAALSEVAETYFATSARWGERLGLMSRLNAAFVLTGVGKAPELTLGYLSYVEERLTPQTEPWKSRIETMRTQANIVQAKEELQSDDSAVAEKGLKTLQTAAQESPFDPTIIYALAEYASKQGDVDKAIELFSKIEALPLLDRILQSDWQRKQQSHQPAGEALLELWEKAGRDEADLQAHLDRVQAESLEHWAHSQDPVELPAEGNRNVLCELFTGAECPPCVAADVAAEAIDVLYPHDRVFVLRYHQHIPAPSPLTNEDSEARFFYYEGQGTPTMVVNGKKSDANVGGVILNAQTVLTDLRPLVDEELAEKTTVAVNLSAKLEGETVNVSAEVTGLEDVTETLRLYVVLAESNITFRAGNGLMHHEFVVRSIVNSVEGTSPADGKLKFAGKVNLVELQKRLSDYLLGFEEGQGVEFSAKPVDLTSLELVAFVQDSETQEILQSNATTIKGGLPKTEKKPAVKPTGDKADDKKPEAGKTATEKPTEKPKESAKPEAKPETKPEPAKKEEAKTESPAKDEAKKDDAPKSGTPEKKDSTES